ARREIKPTLLTDHYILIGHGRVGSIIGRAVRATGAPLLVIDDLKAAVAGVDGTEVEVLKGNAADPELLAAANPLPPPCILTAAPTASEAGTIGEPARAANPMVPIIARVHSDAEHEHLKRLGATHAILAERELALEMLRQAGITTAMPTASATET